VVDFGCGGGTLLADFRCRQRIGVEPSDAARAEAEGRGITCVRSAAALDPEIADVVISNDALEHTLSPFEELTQLRRALKPGGKLVLWLPMDDWRMERPLAGQDPNHHVYTWTPLLLRNLLVEAGFEVHECRVVAHAWPPFTRKLLRLPQPVFDALARLSAVVMRRRQLTAVAVRSD
jgi:SAM-dependent methyltransferase